MTQMIGTDAILAQSHATGTPNMSQSRYSPAKPKFYLAINSSLLNFPRFFATKPRISQVIQFLSRRALLRLISLLAFSGERVGRFSPENLQMYTFTRFVLNRQTSISAYFSSLFCATTCSSSLVGRGIPLRITSSMLCKSAGVFPTSCSRPLVWSMARASSKELIASAGRLNR